MSLALKERREAANAELDAIATALEAGTATDEQRTRAAELPSELEQIRKDEETVAAAAAFRTANPDSPVVPATDDAALRTAAMPGTSTKVTEVSPYADGNAEASFFRDQTQLGDPRTSSEQREASRERLLRHYDSVGDETAVREVRAHSVGTPSEGGYLVAPAYLQNEFVQALAESNAISSLVRTIPIDAAPLGQTVSVNIPTQLTRVGVAAHTENNPLSSSDSTYGTVTAAITRRGGRTTVPNFLLDRSLPGVDKIIMTDLADAAAEDLNDLVINGSVTNQKGFLQETGLGQSTYIDATPDLAGYYAAQLGALQDVLEGVKRGGASAIVMKVRRWFWILGLLDADNRGYMGTIQPNVAIGVNGSPDGGVGPAGHILGVPVYLDNDIPGNLGAGTNQDRVIVGKFDEAWLLRSTPKFAISEHAGFDNDQTKMRVTYDAGFSAARRKAAFSIIDGTGLAL